MSPHIGDGPPSVRSSLLFDSHSLRRTAPPTPLLSSYHNQPRTFRRLQPDLEDVRRERSKVVAAVEHRDDDPRLMLGTKQNAIKSPPTVWKTPCSSTTISQRFRRAVINDDLSAARRLASYAQQLATTREDHGIQLESGGEESISSNRARRHQRANMGQVFSIRNVTSAPPTPSFSSSTNRRTATPSYPRGSVEAEAYLSHLTSLELAIMYNCSLAMMEWLLDMGHEEENLEYGWTRDEEQGRTVLHLAAIANRADVVALYCSYVNRVAGHGASRELVDLPAVGPPIPSTSPQGSTTPGLSPLGRTALHEAAMRGYDAVALVLLSRGGDPRRLDGYGNTALHYASAFGHLTTLQILMDAAANDDRHDNSDALSTSSSSDNLSSSLPEDATTALNAALFGSKNDGDFSAADYSYTLSDRAALEALGRKWFAESREREKRKKWERTMQNAESAAAANSFSSGLTGGGTPRPSSAAKGTKGGEGEKGKNETSAPSKTQRRGSTLDRLKSGAKEVVSGAAASIAAHSPRPRSPRPRSPKTGGGSPRGTSYSPPSSPSRRGGSSSGADATPMSVAPHPRLAAVAGPLTLPGGE
ncbi:ankyrin [Jaminaea rosea]|uniref:Ankyrin n=1 Tax=Jaminaea rosea TaxID=1569628 RepID=A0A316UP09_9BASI|nr:ankyrin [Jaminaea rosea]PWN24905.1 ankyrin [Jaminaea rosea]